MNTDNKSNHILSFRFWDLLLIIILFGISFASLLLFVNPIAGSTVVISQRDYSSEYNIKDHQVVKLDGCIVYIDDGKVWISDADCPDKICENFGKISKAGESIVCVPNEIVIRIIGESEVDGIAG